MPSSVISVMIYDPEASVLQIVFRKTGMTYQYRGVPFDEWLRFCDAPSKGTYLNQELKEKDFPYNRFPSGKAPRLPHGSLQWPASGDETAAAS